MTDCPSRFRLASWTSGDLDVDDARQMKSHVEECGDCAAVLAELTAHVEEYEARQGHHLAQLQARLEQEKTPGTVTRLFPRPAAWATGLAAAAVLGFAFVFVALDQETPSKTPAIQFKGGLALQVVARRGDQQFIVEDGARLRSGDALRFVLTTGSPGYATVFLVDRNQAVSCFYPDSSPDQHADAFTIERAGRLELPGSIVLDDAVGTETLFVVFSPERFDRGPIHQELARSMKEETPPSLDAGIFMERLEVEKTE